MQYNVLNAPESSESLEFDNSSNKLNSTFALHAAAMHFDFELNSKNQGKKLKVYEE